LTFNPSGDEDVNRAKRLYAEIIDMAANLRTVEAVDQHGGPGASMVRIAHSEKNRLLSIAITEAQAAQMWLVKAITWRD
jgi:hypothetical protein